ncbi:hypothetical protein OAS39_10870 [Pirellulales bacterium]|nr:hypothetical protein [Pirellulales bacterium]
MRQIILRVVKVGGSLFELPDLADRLRQWLQSEPAAHNVLIAGGGVLVEQIRALHAVRAIDNEASHWMCIDLMSVTAHLLHDRLPEVWLEEDDGQLCRRIGFQDCTIFGPARWLRHAEPRLPGYRLPIGWPTTSDAIAGRLAVVLGADELVLMKSASPPEGAAGDIAALARCGYVDDTLPHLAGELPPLRCVDLRAATGG